MIQKHFSAVVLGALMIWMFSGKINKGIKGENIEQLYDSSIVAYNNNNYKQAFEYTQRILVVDSTHKKAHLISSICANELGMYNKALKCVDYLIKKNRNDYYLYYLKAKILHNGQLGSSCKEISEAIYLKRCILTSDSLPPSFYSTTKFIEASYKELLEFRMGTCYKEMPYATAMDKNLLSHLQ